MDDVMYGVIESASIEKLENDPPVKASKKLNAPFSWDSNHSWKNELSTPGTGNWVPTRIIIRQINTKKSLCLMSLTLNASATFFNIRLPLQCRLPFQSFPWLLH